MSKVKRIFKIVSTALTYLFLVLCVFALVATLSSRGEGDGAVSVFGYQMRVVISESMEKCPDTDVSGFEIKDIPLKSMVFIEEVPKDSAAADEWYASLKVGDVLTFKYVYQRQETITHRIVDIEESKGGGYIISLEGDNKASDSKTLKQKIDTADTVGLNYIVGKVVGQSYVLGVATWGVRQPLGMVLLIILPCLIIMIIEIIRIVNVLGADKKKRFKEEKNRQNAKIEELEKMILELQRAKELSADVPSPASELPCSDTDIEADASSVQKSLETDL
ncbi:MAG: hypothetical protein J6Q85_07570 [Clostridia bacterium]|nr:hypothetical protein [Clostridia bacterium]